MRSSLFQPGPPLPKHKLFAAASHHRHWLASVISIPDHKRVFPNRSGLSLPGPHTVRHLVSFVNHCEVSVSRHPTGRDWLAGFTEVIVYK